MIKRFAHVCLVTTDLAATERFYCGGLGLKKAFDFIRNDRVVGYYLDLGQGEYIEVFQCEAIDAKAGGPILHFCLEVDDMDQIARRLAEHGYEATPKKLGSEQSWQMWTTDPSGVRIEFHQYTDRSCQITRENCTMK